MTQDSITITRYGKPVRFDWNEGTCLYHFNGDNNYAGYTADELYTMDER